MSSLMKKVLNFTRNPKLAHILAKTSVARRLGTCYELPDHGSAFLPSILKYGIVFTFCLQSVDNKLRFVQLGVKYVNDVFYY